LAAIDRDKAIEAVPLLNDLWSDIFAGDGLFQLLEEHKIRFNSEAHLGYVQRMVFFHLAMALCKLAEFHKHYTRYLPDECRPWLRDLNAEVERRGIREMRNKCIGHILDESTGAPLTPERINEMFARAVGVQGEIRVEEVEQKSEQFYRWMRNKDSPGDLDTVMGRVMWLRNQIMQEHALSASDVGLKPSSSS
jgi:hypothetical protein